MRRILIVGGSMGIGNALLQLLIDDHEIISFSRNAVDLQHVHLVEHNLDITSDDLPDIEQLDGLVYCPGSINLKPISLLSIEDFRNDFEINVIGAVKVIKHYHKALLKGKDSAVVLFSTVAARMGMPYHASVAASKAAVEGLTKSLASEYANKIRFNAIAPTVTDTQLASKLLRNDKSRENIKERHPYKKILSPKEVANLAQYLLSEQSSAISGQIFPIDAGIVSVKL